MNTLAWRILATLLFLAFAGVAPAAARPAPTVCTERVDNTVIAGDLIVPERAYCELNGVTVRGDARVYRQATFAAYNSTIAGSLTGTRFELVTVQHTGVGADLRLTGGVTTWIEGSTISGSARLSDTRDTRVLAAQMWGDLTIRRAADPVQVCGTTVRGDARIAGNMGGVQVGGDLASCAANHVRGHVRVHHNLQQTTVANTTVGRNLVCAANEPAPTVYANQVAGKARGQCGDGTAVDAQELADTE